MDATTSDDTARQTNPLAEPLASAEELLPEEQSDPVTAVRSGLPCEALEAVRRALDAPDRLLARALSISERTLHRRRKQGRLTSEESDRLLLLAEVFELATHAFDDASKARTWLAQPHSLLNGESPLEHMDTIAGIEKIKTMLYHIEYSMPV